MCVLHAGPDLLYKAEISLIDALVGFERQLTLLDGSRVPITHDQVGGQAASLVGLELF